MNFVFDSIDQIVSILSGLNHKELFEIFVKTPLIFIHFFLAAYTIVTILALDFKVMSNFAVPISEQLYDDIRRSEHNITHSLYGLYITGGFFVVYGVMQTPEYLTNSKVIFKMIVVAILTLNGMIVSLLSKKVEAGMVLATKSLLRTLIMVIVGSVSSVSWLWACFLGVARQWNFKMPMDVIATFYLISIGITVAFVAVIMVYRKYEYAYMGR